MLSKRQLKTIRALAKKKHRDETGLFVAEGPKVVKDLAPFFKCVFLGMTAGFARQHPELCAEETAELTQAELEHASFLQAPRDVIAIFRQPQAGSADLGQWPEKELCMALDTIQDPGNLGTIVRIADWFGIRHVFCSPCTVDAFSPKVVQATMGALSRVSLHYVSLPDFIRTLKHDVPVYGTFLRGANIYTEPLEQRGLLVMGNEGNGISPEVESCVNHRLFIPSFPSGQLTSESLNVAVATAIATAEFRRRTHADCISLFPPDTL